MSKVYNYFDYSTKFSLHIVKTLNDTSSIGQVMPVISEQTKEKNISICKHAY